MTAPAMPKLLREIVAYCREAGHDWSNLAEAEKLLASPQVQPAAVSDAEIEAAVEIWFERASADGATFKTRMRDALSAILALRPAQQATPGALTKAWDDGYRLGVEDERNSEANIGVAGFGAKVNPARQNPYRAQQATPEPVGEPYTLIAMGFGRYEVGAGTNGGVPCVAFGRNGNGDVGTIVTEEPRQMTVDETIATITFANVEGLNVLQEKMDEVRALYFADTRPAAAPAVSGLQWLTVAEHGMPDFDEEVIGGLWYTDPWLVPEKATRFLWGLCRVSMDDPRDFKDGKRWVTFGPSHNQITHWARLNVPDLAAAQAKGAG